MISHAANALIEIDAKQQRLAAIERKKTMRNLNKEESKDKRRDSVDQIEFKDG